MWHCLFEVWFAGVSSKSLWVIFSNKRMRTTPGLCALAIRAPHNGRGRSFRWGESHWYPRSLDLRKGDQGSTESSDPPSWGGGTWAEGSGTPGPSMARYETGAGEQVAVLLSDIWSMTALRSSDLKGPYRLERAKAARRLGRSEDSLGC